MELIHVNPSYLYFCTMPLKKEILWNRNFINACLAYLLTAIAFFLFFPTIPLYLTEVLHINPSKIGFVLSSYVLALLFVRPFSGYLVDIFPRKILYLIGIICFMAVFIGYYFAVTVLFFVILRFVHGIFWGLSSVSANTVAIDIIPSSRRAEGIGFFGVNMNIAMAIAPFIGINIYKDYGFQFLITVALIIGALAIIAVLFIKVPSKKQDKNLPKQALSFDRFLLIKGLPIFFNQLFLSFGWGTLGAYAVLYGQEINISNPGYFFLFLAGGIVLSRVNAGKLVDRGYLHTVIITAISIVVVAFFSFAVLHNIYAFNASAFLIGIGYGLLFPALQTIYVNMAPAARRGTANSTYLTGFDLGVGIGLLTGGIMAQYFKGFASLYLLCSVLSIIALVIYILSSKKVYEKNKLTMLN